MCVFTTNIDNYNINNWHGRRERNKKQKRVAYVSERKKRFNWDNNVVSSVLVYNRTGRDIGKQIVARVAKELGEG